MMIIRNVGLHSILCLCILLTPYWFGNNEVHARSSGVSSPGENKLLKNVRDDSWAAWIKQNSTRMHVIPTYKIVEENSEKQKKNKRKKNAKKAKVNKIRKNKKAKVNKVRKNKKAKVNKIRKNKGKAGKKTPNNIMYGTNEELGLVEGDMILSKEQAELLKEGIIDDSNNVTVIGKHRNALLDTKYLWPNGIVFYSIDSSVDSKYHSLIRTTLAGLTSKVSGCIKFQETKSGNRVKITSTSDPVQCLSYVGYQSGIQTLELGVTDKGHCMTTGVIEHEFLHAIGLYHEQSRWDRDTYITIDLDNVEDKLKFAFNKYDKNTITHFGLPYDFYSVMHYGRTAFGINNKVTIQTKDPSKQNIIGQRDGVSSGDIQLIRQMYGCSQGDSKFNCPAGWTTLSTGCYKFINDVNYHEATDECKNDGGYLAEVNSQEEQDAIWSFYKESGLPQTWVWGVSSVWLGANDLAKDGYWVWGNSGEKMLFNAWYQGEPNGGSQENCAQAWGHLGFKWNDLYCGYKVKALCEYDTSDATCNTVEERKVLSLTCPSNHAIGISSAVYGKSDVGCSASNSYSKVKSLCQGKKNCNVDASNGVFGDPCYGTKKFLTICSFCQACNKVDETKTLELSCPSNQQLRIISAVYGHSETGCSASTALSQVRELCQGKKSCKVQATSGVFGDPCSGTVKYLNVCSSCRKGGCIVEDGVVIGRGNNAPNGQGLGTSGQSECSSKCYSNPDCVAWTVRVSDNLCWLKTVYEGHTFKLDGWITGTKECGSNTVASCSYTDNHPSNCPGWKTYCTSGSYISWMATNCAKTCKC